MKSDPEAGKNSEATPSASPEFLLALRLFPSVWWLKVLLQTCTFLQRRWLDSSRAVQLASETSVLPLQPSVALATGREVEVYTAPVEPRISRHRQGTWPTSRAHPACSRILQNTTCITTSWFSATIMMTTTTTTTTITEKMVEVKFR